MLTIKNFKTYKQNRYTKKYFDTALTHFKINIPYSKHGDASFRRAYYLNVTLLRSHDATLSQSHVVRKRQMTRTFPEQTTGVIWYSHFVTASSGNSLELGNASVILDLPRLRFFIKRALFIVEEKMNVDVCFVFRCLWRNFAFCFSHGIIKIRNNVAFSMKNKIIFISFSPLFKMTCDGLNFPVTSWCKRYFSKLKNCRLKNSKTKHKK